MTERATLERIADGLDANKKALASKELRRIATLCFVEWSEADEEQCCNSAERLVEEFKRRDWL